MPVMPPGIDASRQADLDFQDFCRLVYETTGFELSAYKRNQAERRTRAYAFRHGADTLDKFVVNLLTKPGQMQRFLDYITINVTEFFRDPQHFHLMANRVFPELAHAERTVSIWCAGCANGAEAYSLKMLLCQHYPTLPSTIIATDIDHASVQRAQEGLFSEHEVAGIPLAVRRRYLKPEGPNYRLLPAAREGVLFTRHDLLRDPAPSEMDLILCRNVIIYFNNEAKARIFNRLGEALRPGGFLFLGNTERIFDAAVLGLDLVLPHLYRKLPEQLESSSGINRRG